jgi:hypothetical protein
MSKSKGLRLLSWNADGVRGKIHELLDFAVHSVSVDIIAVCETRLTSSIPLKTPGFVCYRQDKHSSGRGQGVAILIRNHLSHTLLPKIITKHIESIGIKITISGAEHVIVSAYQSPNLPLIQSDLDTLFGLNCRVIIVGDFNANHYYWNSSYTNTHGRILVRHMLSSDYTIHAPDIPTQVNYASNKRATTPDLVLTQNVVNISDIKALVALSSNHYPLFCTVDGVLASRNKAHYYRYSDSDWKLYRRTLDDSIILSAYTFQDCVEIDQACHHLQTSILKARDLSVPRCTVSDSTSKLPKHIKKIIRYKNILDDLIPNFLVVVTRSIFVQSLMTSAFQLKTSFEITWINCGTTGLQKSIIPAQIYGEYPNLLSLNPP